MNDFQTPQVVEIHPYHEPLGADNFNQESKDMVETLGQRLIKHNENQIDYYEKQRLEAEKSLARISMMYSGQLIFEFPDEPA